MSESPGSELVEELRRELAGLVGERGLIPVEDEERFLIDERRVYRGSAAAVVRPESAAEVAAVVRLCASRGVTVVPQGGNTGLCGGSVPAANGDDRPTVVISLTRLNRIRLVDPFSATAVVEAGVTIQAVQEAAAEVGLLFAPDWGARGSAQIGGAVSTNAGGLNVIRWGSFRHHVLGLEVVLPDGRLWDGLRTLYKDSSGIDLKQLFIGAEGTLGLVTAAVVRLHSRPNSECSAMATLASRSVLLPLFSFVRDRAGEDLSGFELLPSSGLDDVVKNIPSAQAPTLAAGDWFVLIRFSGDDAASDRLAACLAEAVDDGLITDAVVAATAAQEANLWLIRDELPFARKHEDGDERLKFDIALPVNHIVDFLDQAEQDLERIVPGTRPFVFGHVGDGNLHFSVHPGPGTDRQLFARRMGDLVDAIDSLTWEYGGSISAEHGIGQEMRERLRGQKPDVEFELMARLKEVLDPGNIMNPGKVLPETLGD